jgi:hypothetical protein
VSRQAVISGLDQPQQLATVTFELEARPQQLQLFLREKCVFPERIGEKIGRYNVAVAVHS